MYKTNSLPKLFLLAAIAVLASFSLIAPSFVQAIEILFEDNFKGGKLDGSGKWHVALGKWTIQGGELRNTSADKSLIIVADDHWQPEWVDYWFYSKIRITGGTQPAIFWRFHSDGSQGGNFSPAGNLPKRMQNSGRRHVIYWWFNKEGGGAVVQRDIRTIVKPFEITETKTKINAGDEYYIKIENALKSYKLYLSDKPGAVAAGNFGEPIVDLEALGKKDLGIKAEGRIGFGTVDGKIIVDDVFVTTPEGNPFSVEAKGKLATVWGKLKAGQ